MGGSHLLTAYFMHVISSMVTANPQAGILPSWDGTDESEWPQEARSRMGVRWDSGANLPGFHLQLCHVLALWPHTGDLPVEHRWLR